MNSLSFLRDYLGKTLMSEEDSSSTRHHDEGQNRSARLVFLAAFLVLLLLNWILFESIIHPIIFAGILAGTFSPFFNWLLLRTRWSREVCSLITCLIITFVIVMPLIYIAFQLSRESINFYFVVRDGLTKESVNNFLFGEGQVATLIKSFSDSLDLQLTPEEVKYKILEYIRSYSSTLLNSINQWVGNLALIIFDFLIMLLVAYGLLVDGPRLKAFFFNLSPLPDDQEELMVKKFNQMNYVTLVCNGLGGVLQGAFAIIGFYLVGIPSLFLWFTTMTLLAFVPLVGISFITVPASAYLIISGEIAQGFFLFIYTSIVAIVVENWFKPMFIGKRVQVNSLMVLIYIIGGMAVFGTAGIFYGPLIYILFLTVVELYHEHYAQDFKNFHLHKD